MAIFNIDQFRQTVFSSGLARENRFEVLLPKKLTGTFPVSIMCESTALPQMSVVTKQQRLFGPTYNRAATVDYGGAGLQMVFFVDRDMEVKKYFDKWMHLCVTNSAFTANYLEEYAFDVEIFQLNEQDEVTYSVKLVEAFPTNAGPMQLSQVSNDTFHRLPVTLTYRYWETEDISNTDSYLNLDSPADVPRTLTFEELLRTRTQQPVSRVGPGYTNTARDYTDARARQELNNSLL